MRRNTSGSYFRTGIMILSFKPLIGLMIALDLTLVPSFGDLLALGLGDAAFFAPFWCLTIS